MKGSRKLTALTTVRKYLDINNTVSCSRHLLNLSLSTVHELGCFVVKPQIIESVS